MSIYAVTAALYRAQGPLATEVVLGELVIAHDAAEAARKVLERPREDGIDTYAAEVFTREVRA